MFKRGPRINTKLRESKFKPSTKLPRLIRMKRMMPSEMKLATGMMKGIKKKPMFPRKRGKIIM